jgi:tetratricopeptide (TPR) repeat protein
LPEPTSKRLVFLEKITAEGSTDPMAFYSLAMEYRGLGRFDDALQTFTSLRSKTPDYVPMYLMCGQMLEKLERFNDARGWYETGIVKARASGNGHAASELESALDACVSAVASR